jgi:predicted metal-dependent peptidase
MNQMNKMQKAKAKMLLTQVFFATLVMSTPMVVDTTLPTAATDMLTIFYNPAFIEGLTLPQVMFVLAHEVMHIVFKHGLRRGSRNPQLWNIACDYAINLILHEAGFEVIQGCLFDPRFKGMSAEQVYDMLKQEMDKENKKRKQNGEGKAGPGDLHQDTSGMGEDVREPANIDAEARAKAEQQIQQKVAQAANMARMAGKMPAGVARLVDEILNPTVPWQDLLREYMTRVTKDNESWSRRNRRFTDVYLPSRHSQRMGEIVVIGDTSGSITNQELARIASEVAAISEAVNPERIRLVWADTEVAGEQEFEAGDIIKADPKGGGGTDMRVPLQHIDQYQPEIAVLVTDGYTPWPNVEPEYPLIVVCTTKVDVPIGQVVRI